MNASECVSFFRNTINYNYIAVAAFFSVAPLGKVDLPTLNNTINWYRKATEALSLSRAATGNF